MDLKGTYTLVGIEFGGKALPEADIAKLPEGDRVLKITADKVIANKGGKEDPADYKIDTTKTPHEIDLTAKKDDGKDEKLVGIFKVDGDTLIICAVESDKAANRPKEFKTTADNKAMIMTLKKKK